MVLKYNYSQILIDTFPEFRDSETFNSHCEFWGSDIKNMFDVGQVYIAFTHFTVDEVLAKRNIHLAKKILNWIEDILQSNFGKNADENSGESHFRTAIYCTFLEGLINHASHGNIDYLSFVSLLGNASKQYCKECDKSMGVRTPGLWTDKEWRESQTV